MPYSLWANREKIGETRFELRPGPHKLAGALHPTQLGLAVLPTIATPAATRLELRDPMGRTLLWSSIIISDMTELARAAGKQRHDALSRLSALPGNSIRFMIAATLTDSTPGASGLAERSVS